MDNDYDHGWCFNEVLEGAVYGPLMKPKSKPPKCRNN